MLSHTVKYSEKDNRDIKINFSGNTDFYYYRSGETMGCVGKGCDNDIHTITSDGKSIQHV